MSKKNLLIALDQGLGDAISATSTIDLIADMVKDDYNIIIIGPYNSVQVFKDRPYIHASHVILRKGGLLKRIATFYKALQFVKSNKIDYCIKMIGMKHSIFYASFKCSFSLLKTEYKYYIAILLHIAKCKNAKNYFIDNLCSYFDTINSKGHYQCERQYQIVLKSVANQLPEYFKDTNFTDSKFCIPRIACEKHTFQRPTIGIHPGTSIAVILYPVEIYADVAFELAVKHGCDIAIFGGNKKEIEYRRRIIERLKNLGFNSENIITPQLNGFQDLRNNIGSLALLICNDSGPMHLASALNVPVCAYPSVGKYFIEYRWQPCIDGDRFAAFSAQDLCIFYSKTLFGKKKLHFARDLNIKQVIDGIVQSVDKRNLLTLATKQ